MTNAKNWLIGGIFIALMALQVQPVAAQQFPGFSKKLGDYKLSEKTSVLVYRNTKGKKQVGLISDPPVRSPIMSLDHHGVSTATGVAAASGFIMGIPLREGPRLPTPWQ